MGMSKTSNKLHLGCGSKILPGYCNTDLENWSGKCDYVLDARDLSIFPDNRFELVYTRQMLEHIPPWDTMMALKEWYRVLNPGGKVRISVPDLKQIFEGWLVTGETTENEALKNIYGNTLPYEKRYKNRAHLTGFTFERLRRLLEEVGFVDVVQLEEKKLILLVEATKGS